MSESQQHAERLREMADNTMLGSCGTPTQSQINDQAALLAGARALEALGRWFLTTHSGKHYMIPVDRWGEWCVWKDGAEAGEPSSIIPTWAEEVDRAVVITGWVR